LVASIRRLPERKWQTVIRGGYRLLYDPPFYNIYLNEATAAPQVFLQTFTNAASSAFPAANLPMPAVPTGPNVRAEVSPFITPGVFDPRTQAETNITPNFGPDRVHTWSLGLERELTKNSAFEARYVGNAARRLFQTVNGNPFIADLQASFPQLIPAGLTPCAASQQVGTGAGTDVGRVNCGQGVLRTRANTGFSNYNAYRQSSVPTIWPTNSQKLHNRLRTTLHAVTSRNRVVQLSR
jgi:hypothetical protein